MRITILYNKETYTVEVNIGDSLEDAINIFGEAAVYKTYRDGAVQKINTFVRNKLRGGKPLDQIQTELTTKWRPIGGTRFRKSSVENLLNTLGLDEEEKKELLQKYIDRQKKGE